MWKYWEKTLAEREELMKEKEKSWEQKLEDSRQVNKMLQEQMRNEMASKQAEFRKKLELMNLEKESLLKDMEQMKSSLTEKEYQQQEVIKEELNKAQKEYERKQNDFEKGRIVETAINLQAYYDNKLKELQNTYEEKIQQRGNNKETMEEIEKLKQFNLILKDSLTKNQKDLQLQMKSFTNDRTILSKQIQQLQSKIHILEHNTYSTNNNTNNNTNTDQVIEYNAIKQKKAEEEHKYNLLQSEYKILNEKIESDKKLLEELNMKHSNITQELDYNSKLLSDVKREYLELNNKLETDKIEYNNLLSKKEELYKEIIVLKEDLERHIDKARIQLKNPTIDDLLKIKDGFDNIFNNISSIKRE